MNRELLIQKYFKGILNADDQRSFDQLMENDEEFASEVSEFENLQKAIRESERLSLKDQLIQLEQENFSVNTKSNIRQLWPLAIAAAFAILLAIAGILYWPSFTSPEQLYASNFEPYPNALMPIKRGQETTSLDVQAFLAYEEGNYTLAIEKFETLLSNKDSTNLRFYYAMSLQNLGKLTLALNELKQVDKKTERFQAQVEWYLALIYIQKQEWQHARERLNNVMNSNQKFKQTEAKKLLKKIPND